jgi:predicted dienelactone hydrolase
MALAPGASGLCSKLNMSYPALAVILSALTLPSEPSMRRASPAPTRWFPVDDARERRVPVAVYEPGPETRRQSRLVLLSPGFGVPNTEYGFLARALTTAGYAVLSVQHLLPTDPPPPRGDGLSHYLKKSMQEGILNLRFILATAARHWPWVDQEQVILIGHSHGGDLSALMGTESPEMVADLVTLDHGRVRLPRASRPRQLSLRASGREPDRGVLPTAKEQGRFGIEVIRIAGAKHMDFTDSGPAEIKRKVVEEVLKHLQHIPPDAR